MINLRNTKGFTLTEVMFVLVISVIVIGVIVSAWIFTYKTWTVESRRTMVRVDMLKALETIQSDIRLSSATYMSFYPSTSTTGEYTAVSMPIADTDSNGYYTLDSDGNIDWDRTVIYHIYNETDGTQTLRRTVFDPRDNSLDHDDLYQQLSDVISDGTGGTGSSTDTTFLRNLQDFTISTVPSKVEFYENSTDPVRVGRVVFGWARFGSGDHTIKFEVTGKNADSSGYGMGVDQIMITPAGGKRQAEYYNSSFAPSGSLSSNGKTVNRVYNPLWSNRNYLEYLSTQEGDYIEFTDYYDLWRESTFEHSSRTNTMMWNEEDRGKLVLPQDRQTGGEMIAWYAYQQAVDSVQGGHDVSRTVPRTFRTIIKNNVITADGDAIRVLFKSSTNNPFKIDAAYITRRNSADDGYPNQATGSDPVTTYHRHQQLFFKDTYDMDGDGSTTDMVPYLYIPANSEAWSEWIAFPLRRTDSSGTSLEYLISYHVPDLASTTFPTGWTYNSSNTNFKYWESSVTNAYYVASSGSYTTAGTPVWSGTASTYYYIYAVAEIDTWQKTGTVESDIFDTCLSSPSYNKLGWSESAPANTEITLKARSSASQFMTGATAWTSITGSTANPQSLSIGSGRYVQFQATLTAEPFWKQGSYTRTYAQYVDDQRALAAYQFPTNSSEYLVTGLYSTWLDDVTIDWPGDDKICVVSGYIARKDDYGQAKVTIDGRDIIKVLGVDLGVSEEFQDKQISETLSLEVEPRNTGR